MKKWWQRWSGLVRWTIWSWRQRRRLAGDPALRERAPRQERAPCAPDGADEAAQVDPAVAAELRVLVALYEASRRELP
jgi:hypothetical protein